MTVRYIIQLAKLLSVLVAGSCEHLVVDVSSTWWRVGGLQGLSHFFSVGSAGSQKNEGTIPCRWCAENSKRPVFNDINMPTSKIIFCERKIRVIRAFTENVLIMTVQRLVAVIEDSKENFLCWRRCTNVLRHMLHIFVGWNKNYEGQRKSTKTRILSLTKPLTKHRLVGQQHITPLEEYINITPKSF